MDFTLSKQQAMVQKMYKEFAENEVKPLAKKVDAEEYFPKETVEKMGKLGMMGIYFPKEVGGAGGDVLSYVMAVEEMSKVCGTTGVILSAHTSLCAAPIFENGTPEQKAKYLPKLCSGEWIGAFGLTEPGAGTDAQGQQTYAVLDEATNEWVLNGSKIFITNAGYANVFIIIAVTGTVLDKRGRTAVSRLALHIAHGGQEQGGVLVVRRHGSLARDALAAFFRRRRGTRLFLLREPSFFQSLEGIVLEAVVVCHGSPLLLKKKPRQDRGFFHWIKKTSTAGQAGLRERPQQEPQRRELRKPQGPQEHRQGRQQPEQPRELRWSRQAGPEQQLQARQRAWQARLRWSGVRP